jgi:hypothetical protein
MVSIDFAPGAALVVIGTVIGWSALTYLIWLLRREEE